MQEKGTDRKAAIEQARFIATAGKMLHDYLLKSQADHISFNCRNSPFGDATVSQMHLVNTVMVYGQLSMKELSGLMNVSPPSATVMVDRLVEKGLLIRKHSTRDRRKVVVSISPEAETYIKAMQDSVLTSCALLVEKLGSETADQWCSVLRKVKQILETDFNLPSSPALDDPREAGEREHLKE